MPTSRSSRARPAARALPGYQITPPCVFSRFSNPEQMAAAQREAVDASGFKPRSGKQNAQIGLKGFTQVSAAAAAAAFQSLSITCRCDRNLTPVTSRCTRWPSQFCPKLSVVEKQIKQTYPPQTHTQELSGGVGGGNSARVLSVDTCFLATKHCIAVHKDGRST